jgi:hypothetical protein
MTRTSKSITPRKAAPPLMIQKPVVESIQRPSLGQSMKEGFGLGVGVSVAQHAVNGVMNFLTPPKASNPVENSKVQEYEKCMKYSSNDVDLCKNLLDN